MDGLEFFIFSYYNEAGEAVEVSFQGEGNTDDVMEAFVKFFRASFGWDATFTVDTGYVVKEYKT